jgi:5-methylthioadenosine/S-adenosylhomocysteine deaminase
MPGFINCHYHSECAVGPGLIQFVFEKANLYLGGKDRFDEADLEAVVLLGLINCVRGGQTGLVDVYYGKPSMPLFGCEPVLRAHERIGLRTAFGLAVRDQNKYIHAPDEEFLRMLPPEVAAEVAQTSMGYAWPVDDIVAAYGQLVENWDGRDGRIRILLAPDWTPACSDDLYRRCRQLTTDYGTGLTSHVLETRSEMMFNIETYGKTAMRRLFDLGILGDDVTFAHFVWATDEDLALFADSGTVASNNPGSNLRLSSGIARVRDIMALGGSVGFGTDGISYSDTEDFFQELRLACYLQRIPRDFPGGRLDSAEVLRSAGESGSRAVGFPGRTGRLRAGALADLLVVSKERLLFPAERYQGEPVLNLLLDRADSRDIRLSMIHGQVVLEDGVITTLDEHAIRDQVAEATERGMYSLSASDKRRSELAGLLMPHVTDFYRPWDTVPIEPAYVYNAKAPPPKG